MSAAKEYYDRRVAELCSEIRLASLKIAELLAQEEDIVKKKQQLLEEHRSLKSALSKVVGQACRDLYPGQDYTCLVDKGILSPSDICNAE